MSLIFPLPYIIIVVFVPLYHCLILLQLQLENACTVCLHSGIAFAYLAKDTAKVTYPYRTTSETVQFLITDIPETTPWVEENGLVMLLIIRIVIH